jgi:hypothetical protein
MSNSTLCARSILRRVHGSDGHAATMVHIEFRTRAFFVERKFDTPVCDPSMVDIAFDGTNPVLST